MKTAERIADDGLHRFGRSDADAVWSLRVLRGELLNSTATCKAAGDYLRAIALPARLARSRAASDRLLALGLAQSHCGDVAAARESFAGAMRIAHAVAPDAEAAALVRKADFEIATRAWTGAARDIRALLALAARTRQTRYESRGWAALGKLRGQQERFDEAIDANEKALAIAQSDSDTPLALVTRMNLGWLFVASGDYPRAIEMLGAADAEASRLGRKNDRVVALMQLGNAYLNQDRYSEARDYYSRALAIADQLNSPDRATLLDNLARVAFASNDYKAAETLNARAVALYGDRPDAARSAVTAARIAEKLGRGAEAEAKYRSVIDTAKSRLARFEAMYFLAMHDAARGDKAAAERGLQRTLALAEQVRAELKSDELKLSFTTTLGTVVNNFIMFLVDEHRAADALRIAELTRARALRTKAAGTDYTRIARQRGTILSYWLTPNVSFLWTITPSHIVVFRLPPQGEIAAAVDAYQRELAGPRGSLEMSAARGEQLWSMLIAPAASQIGRAKQFVVIADKRLNALNFETLIVPSPRPHYWIEDATITTALSIDLLARRRPAEAVPETLLLVGDPPRSDPALPPLAWARNEMQRVRTHFPDATVISGTRATPSAYESAATPRYAFVHFVAHGIGNATRPLDSAVVLGRDASGYKLYARDILQHPLNAQLVTISSCYGAGQRAYAGEGLVGLAWAFLRAGAHEVIAALWEVSDSATPQLMDAMYARIQRGDGPADALRAAKLTLLRSNSVYRRPLYWAPFVLYSGS